jgi:hypothetical protein
LQQISNRDGKGDLATYGDVAIPTVKHLSAPIACESSFIKEHDKTSICATGRPAAPHQFAAHERQGFVGGHSPIFPSLMNGTCANHLPTTRVCAFLNRRGLHKGRSTFR